MDIAEFTQALQQLLVLTDAFGRAALTSFLPRIIADAEGRIYLDEELDFLVTRISDISQVTAPGQRSVPIPNTFRIIESVNLITPAGTFPSDSPGPEGQPGGRPPGSRLPLIRVDRTFLDIVWPEESAVMPPPRWETYYAVYSFDKPGPAKEATDAGGVVDGVQADASEFKTGMPSAILIAPTPDGGYQVEMIGVGRPAPLSAENTTTPLTTLYPELFLSAAMVIALALTKNWSAVADDPRSAVTWEAHYNACREVAKGESRRQKSQAAGMTPSGPALYPERPTVQPPPQG